MVVCVCLSVCLCLGLCVCLCEGLSVWRMVEWQVFGAQKKVFGAQKKGAKGAGPGRIQVFGPGQASGCNTARAEYNQVI